MTNPNLDPKTKREAPQAKRTPKANPAPVAVTAKRPAARKAAVPPAPKAPSKVAQVVALLRREEGATTKVLMDATGWQAHSVRGIIAGAIKKKLGLTVVSEAGESGRTYRIAKEEASA